jgi:glycosyltransferase involved in cell wall biosynthesis
MTIRYTLISPARNEEAYIRKTLDSVVRQTIRPQRWLIVDDGSTDNTGAIVREYAEKYEFVELITRSSGRERSFASKSRAIADAYEKLGSVEFEYIGNLDTDIELPESYYEDILREMERDSELGIAGGIRYDLVNGQFELVDCARNSVGGPIQLFRRRCYEQIGGYMALPYGGIDGVAEISARMCGWKVRSFPEYRVHHYRATGTAGRSIWSACYRAGIRDYAVGYHPVFAFARMLNSLGDRPFILAAVTKMAGYLTAMAKRTERPVPPELVTFLRKEQMERLRNYLTPMTNAAE